MRTLMTSKMRVWGHGSCQARVLLCSSGVLYVVCSTPAAVPRVDVLVPRCISLKSHAEGDVFIVVICNNNKSSATGLPAKP
jgi:hypothetical protein